MRYLATLAVSALAVSVLAACSASSAPGAAPPAAAAPRAPGGLVAGAITWPDGHPAANTQVFWYPGGYTPDPARPPAESQIPADGGYSLAGCPCSQLTGYLHVPPPSLAWPADKIPGCWIILRARGTYTGITARPGEVINWRALAMPCAPAPFSSDPAHVRQEIQLLTAELASPLSGLTAAGGSWQDAENRTKDR